MEQGLAALDGWGVNAIAIRFNAMISWLYFVTIPKVGEPEHFDSYAAAEDRAREFSAAGIDAVVADIRGKRMQLIPA